MLVRYGAHDASDGEAVEIVVDEDKAAKTDRGELGTLSGSDLFGGPVAECGAAARAVHELDHDAQNDQENKNAHVVGIGEHSDDAIVKDMVEGPLKAVTGVKKSAGDNADEQRAVHFFGDQCQGDRDDRRYQ